MTHTRQSHCLALLEKCPLIGMFSLADFARGYRDAGDTIENAHADLLDLYDAGVIELRPGDPLRKEDAPLLLPGPMDSKMVFARLIERETGEQS